MALKENIFWGFFVGKPVGLEPEPRWQRTEIKFQILKRYPKFSVFESSLYLWSLEALDKLIEVLNKE
jgi:hypothetical protein